MFTEPPGSPAATSPWRRDLLLLALLFGAFYFFLLGRHPLANPDEGRYAEIPREMIATGDYVTPRLNGVNYFEKPPLMYWAVAGCIRLFGSNEWAVRVMPALSGLGGVLLTYAAARRLYGRMAGLASAIVLGTALLFFALSRLLILDMAVSMLMCATLFCFILGVREVPGPRRRWLFLGLYASAALATLTKGPIGFLVTGAVMFLWLLIFNQWKRLRPLHLPTGLALFLAIAAPWHVLVASRNPEWAHFYFVYENWERFTSVSGHERSAPWWIFAPVVLLGLFPWMGFLWAGLRESLAGGWARRRENADAWFLVTWAAFVFLFFSKSQSKLIPYILPVFPPLAVIIGAWLARCWADGTASRLRAGLNVFAFISGLLAVALLVAVLKPGILREAGQAELLRPYAFGMAAVLVLGGVTAPWAARLRAARAALLTVLSTAVGLDLLLVVAAPLIPKPGTKELALMVAARAQPGDRVYHYYDFFHDFTFYAERFTGTVEFHGDELELGNDPAARASGRFITETEFDRQWRGSGRIFLVVRKQKIGEVCDDYARAQAAWKQANQPGRAPPPRPVFADATFQYYLLGESRGHYLYSNQP
jgi:4-amino-4-deoxy-L-arabinose transferase-like glycosyltransferase